MKENNIITETHEANIREICSKEHSFLRRELVHLKECQIKFFTFSVTATGLILGIGRSGFLFASSKLPSGDLWLYPLVIIIPAWWVFFDKATTITRIVGYFRILEKLILNTLEAKQFKGWENNLAKFRTYVQNDKDNNDTKKGDSNKENKIKTLFNIMSFRTTNRYWVITYYTFLLLSAVCWLGSLKEAHMLFISFSGIIILISVIYNLNILYSLIHGKYSYNFNEHIWEQVLEVAKK
jgi:hypothetical protein